MAQVLIVGAGVAGLAAGRELARAGHGVTVLEKSRGLGGRVATRRLEGFAIDHGAQLMKAPTPALRALVDEAGGAHDIAEPVWIFGGDGAVGPGDPAMNAEPKWTWPGGISALAKQLGRGLETRLEATVAALSSAPGGPLGLRHTLYDGGGAALAEADAVLLTAPAPQSAAILRAGEQPEAVRGPLLEALGAVSYRPCLSVALAYARRPDLPWYAAVNVDRRHPVAWLACDHLKPGRAPEGHGLLLAQMSPAWSEAHWEELAKGTYGQGAPLPAPAAEAAALAGALVGQDLGPPLWANAQRWRYALADAPCGLAALEGRGGIFAAGDMEAGQGRVHLAIESGWRAARRILDALG